MASALSEVLAQIQSLSASERAMAAHCLIVSLDDHQDEDSDQTWIALAEQRYAELESGEVPGVSWDEIKRRIKA